MISRTTLTRVRILMITGLFLLMTNGSSAIPVEEWNRTFGGETWDEARFVFQTPDEGYIITGSTSLNDSYYGVTGWIIKTDPEGSMQWNRSYPAKWILNVSITRDGGYILRGVSNNNDLWLMGTDASGIEQWNMTRIVKNSTYIINIKETTDAGFVVAVAEAIPMHQGFPYWRSRIIKFDERGDEEWNITLNRHDDFEVWSAQQTSDGGYVLAGGVLYSYANYILPGIPIMDYGDSDILLVKTDANGSQQWEKKFGWWGEREGTNYVMQTRDGGYIIEGSKASKFYDGPDYNKWIIKTDASGNEEWNRDFGKSWGPFFSSIQQTSDGGYVFASSMKFETNEIYDWLMKIDADGNIQWKKLLEGTKMEKDKNNIAGYSIIETSDHSYIIASSTESYGAGGSDAWLVKIKDTGTSALENKDKDFYGSDKRSMSGFEILIDIFSILIIFIFAGKRT